MKLKNSKMIRNIIIVISAIIAIVCILKIAPNYRKAEFEGVTNLIINNNNITGNLKRDIVIDENGIIYLSKQDIANFFDKYIYYDNTKNTNEKVYNQIITTSDTKVATLKLNEEKMTVNGVELEIKGCAKEIDGTIYLPFSEMEDIYNIKIEHIKESDIITVESLNRKLVVTNANKNLNIKAKRTSFSRSPDLRRWHPFG